MIVAVWLALASSLGLAAWSVLSRAGRVPLLVARTGGGVQAGLLLFAALGYREAGLPLAVAVAPWLALPDRLGPVWALGADALGLGFAAAAALWLARLPAVSGAEAAPAATRRPRAWLPVALLLALLARDLGVAAVAGVLAVAATLAGETAAPRGAAGPWHRLLRAPLLALALGGVAALWRLTASAAVPVVSLAMVRIYPLGTPRAVVALGALAVVGLGLPWLAPPRRNVAAHGATALVGLFAIWRVGAALLTLAGPGPVVALAGVGALSLGLGLWRRRLAPLFPAALVIALAATAWPGLAGRVPDLFADVAVGLAVGVALLLGPLADVPPGLRRAPLVWLAGPGAQTPEEPDAAPGAAGGVGGHGGVGGATVSDLKWRPAPSRHVPLRATTPWARFWPLGLALPALLLWSRWLDGFNGHPLGQPLALVAATLAALRAARHGWVALAGAVVAGLAATLSPRLDLLLLGLGLAGGAVAWAPAGAARDRRVGPALAWLGWLGLPFVVGTLVRLALGLGATNARAAWTADTLPAAGGWVTLLAWGVAGVGLALGGGAARRAGERLPWNPVPPWPRAVGLLLWAALAWRWGLPPAAGVVAGTPALAWLVVPLGWLAAWRARPALGRALAPVAVGGLAVLAWTPAALAGHLLWLLARELAWQADADAAPGDPQPDGPAGDRAPPGWEFKPLAVLGALLVVLGGIDAAWWLGVASAVALGWATLAPGGEDATGGNAWGGPPPRTGGGRGGPRRAARLAAGLLAVALTVAPWLLVGGAARLDAAMLDAPPLAYRGATSH